MGPHCDQMKRADSLKKSIILSVSFALVLWWVAIFDLILPWEFSKAGVLPRHPDGLIGILLAPFVHGSFAHLIANTLPVVVLFSLLIWGYAASRWRAMITIWLLSGVGVWLFARDAYHIGASGLTHGVFFYLLAASIIRRDKRSIAVMMIGFFLYGSMVMTIFPSEPNISFEYHFFGALAGVLAAWWFSRQDPKPMEKRYPWQDSDEVDDIIGDEWQHTDDQSRQ